MSNLDHMFGELDAGRNPWAGRDRGQKHRLPPPPPATPRGPNLPGTKAEGRRKLERAYGLEPVGMYRGKADMIFLGANPASPYAEEIANQRQGILSAMSNMDPKNPFAYTGARMYEVLCKEFGALRKEVSRVRLHNFEERLEAGRKMGARLLARLKWLGVAVHLLEYDQGFRTFKTGTGVEKKIESEMVSMSDKHDTVSRFVVGGIQKVIRLHYDEGGGGW